MSTMNPPSMLLARTPALPSTSTSSTHMPSSKSDYAYPSGASLTKTAFPSSEAPRPSLSPLANLHPAFTTDSSLPGTVEIRVEATTFLVHREILVHASPFFEVLLNGEWAETVGLDDGEETEEQRGRSQCDSCDRRRQSGHSSQAHSTIEPSSRDLSPKPAGLQSPGLGDRRDLHRLSAASFVTTHTSNDAMSPLDEATLLLPEPPRPPSVRLRKARPLSMASITTDPDSGGDRGPPSTPTRGAIRERDADETTIASSYIDDELGLELERPPAQRLGGKKLDARIHLKEEQAAPFQDLLMFVYPHLECVCTWNNAPELMTMARKFDMPLLRRHVLHFLLTSAAGKPIQAMRIAEDHQLTELYRESSRYILDNFGNWDAKELESLSSDTLLKLEKRRSWFLERLLKLGLVNSSRDYVCPPTCPDPQHCARLVDDKWRSAWAASFRFGPPQPSSIYRALRSLEPSLHSPALLLPHTSCQMHAVRFFADLVDRMFGLLGLTSVSATSTTSTGLDAARKAKYFLSIELYADLPPRERKWTGTGQLGGYGGALHSNSPGLSGPGGAGGVGSGGGSTPGGLVGFPTGATPTSLQSL